MWREGLCWEYDKSREGIIWPRPKFTPWSDDATIFYSFTAHPVESLHKRARQAVIIELVIKEDLNNRITTALSLFPMSCLDHTTTERRLCLYSSCHLLINFFIVCNLRNFVECQTQSATGSSRRFQRYPTTQVKVPSQFSSTMDQTWIASIHCAFCWPS